VNPAHLQLTGEPPAVERGVAAGADNRAGPPAPDPLTPALLVTAIVDPSGYASVSTCFGSRPSIVRAAQEQLEWIGLSRA
jgi:hypothetical protein